MGIRTWWSNLGRQPEIEVAPIIPADDMDEEDKAALRSAAALEVEAALKLKDTITEHMFTASRWLQTWLLALNAGAATALLQSDQIEPHHRALAGGAFIVGVLLALLSAYLGIRMSIDAPARLSRSAGYWLGVSGSLFRSEKLEREFQEYAIEMTRRARVPNMIAWASIVSFTTGCAVAALGLVA